MTTKELIEIFETMGISYKMYNLESDEPRHLEFFNDKGVLARISLKNENKWEIYGEALEREVDVIRSAFASIITDYLKTPLEKRGVFEEEKRYYLRHKWILNVDNHLFGYFDDDYESWEYWLDSKEADGINTFTEKEIEHMKKELDTDLKDFEMVEVEDEI